MDVTALTCNYLANPLGIDTNPRFSWKCVSRRRGETQSSYRLVVTRGDVVTWDTGVRAGIDSVLQPYTGPRLAPRTRYQWSVTVTDGDGRPWVSDPAWFETAKRDEPWAATWIGVPGMDIEREETTYGAPHLRRGFSCARPVASARLYIAGLGLYEAAVNGVPPTPNVLLQGFTRYDATVLYNTYDVTALLEPGENTLAVTLGNGWYNCVTHDPWWTREATWRSVPKLLAELRIRYTDGTEEVVGTGPDWKTHPGPVTYNSIRSGESYDARLEIPGWDRPGFDDRGWQATVVVRTPGGILRADEMEPIRVFESVPAVRKWKVPSGSWVFDVGRNLAGVARVRLRGPSGTTVKLVHNECLLPDGSLTREGGFISHGEFQVATYIKAGNGPETWQPRFVYYGFQYVELAGLDYEPDLADVTAIVERTDLARRGTFASSDETLNGIFRITEASTLSNYHGLPTDCPHREKNGWIGDSAVSCEQTILNHAPMAGYTKWMRDFLDCQKPGGAVPCVVPSTGWGYNQWNGPDYSSTLFSIPWLLWVYCGDRGILSLCYDAMKRQTAHVQAMAVDNIVGYGGGDWCPPFDGPAYFESMSSYKTPRQVTDTAYYHSSTRILAAVAGILGHAEEQRIYGELADRIKTSFRRAFYDPAGPRVTGDCQTSTACMLYHELADPPEVPALVNLLATQIREKDGHLDFGIFGSKAVMHALGRHGRADLGYVMASKTTYPGWGHWLAQGATTLWECWNGGGSHNHHMFGDVTAFFHLYLAGIQADPAEPGFRHVIFRPALDSGPVWVESTHESMLGRVSCRWKRMAGGYEVRVEVPVGSRATLRLPWPADVRDLEEPAAAARGPVTAIDLLSGAYGWRVTPIEPA